MGSGAQVKYEKFPVSLATAAAEAFRLMGVQVLFLDNFRGGVGEGGVLSGQGGRGRGGASGEGPRGENLAGKPHGETTARSISELMKSFADRAAEHGAAAPRVVVAGIPGVSAALIQLDLATGTRLEPRRLRYTRMPEDELESNPHARREEARHHVRGVAAGSDQSSPRTDFPTTRTCSPCIPADALFTAVARTSLDDFDASLASILADCDLELRTAYEAAIETTGEVQMRKSVMEAIATLNDLEVPFKSIRESFPRLHPEYGSIDKLNFLSTAITPLEDEYKLLTDSGKPRVRK